MSPIISTLANASAYGFRSLSAAAAGAYESIASATGTGSSGTITFTSIPSTYVALQLRGIAKTTGTASGVGSYRISANGVGGTSYARHLLRGDGSTVGASGSPDLAYIDTYGGVATNNASFANMMGTIILDIHDYASTTKTKTFRLCAGVDLNFTSSVAGTIELTSGLFNSTSAITSLSIVAGSGSWGTSTVFSLYGIKGA